MDKILLTVVFLSMNTFAKEEHGTVESLFSQAYFVMMDIICHTDDLTMSDDAKKEYRNTILMSSFQYWLSVRGRLIPENKIISNIAKHSVAKADDPAWRFLLEGAEVKHSCLLWYDYRNWKHDVSVFRKGGGAITK